MCINMYGAICRHPGTLKGCDFGHLVCLMLGLVWLLMLGDLSPLYQATYDVVGWGGCLGLGLGSLLELPGIAPPGMVALEMTECLLVLGKLLFCTQGIGRGVEGPLCQRCLA